MWREGLCQMKNSSDTIWNGTRDFPACNAVPQPTAPPRAPRVTDKTWLNEPTKQLGLLQVNSRMMRSCSVNKGSTRWPCFLHRAIRDIPGTPDHGCKVHLCSSKSPRGNNNVISITRLECICCLTQLYCSVSTV